MANRKTLDFLPNIFQSEVNQKFLNATLDQLISDPEFVKLNGYVGRKFAPTYKTTDSYILENDADRKNYQLEPSVVVSKNNNIEFYSSYTDLLNKIEYYGGEIKNQNRLFSSDYYSFRGLIDLDKFVNFSEYYWVPNGPSPVMVGNSIVNSHETFDVTRGSLDHSYIFGQRQLKNPELTLMRGGVYKFKVNQPGNKFWIQTEPGISGTKKLLPSVSTRDILGVTNNGGDNGTVEFFVPLANAQDKYLKMPLVATVDFAISNIRMIDLDGADLKIIHSYYNGFDGVKLDLDGKTFVFLTDSDTDNDWYSGVQTKTIPKKLRRGIWRIVVDRSDPPGQVITLQYISDIAVNSKVYVRSGLTNKHTEFFKNDNDKFSQVPKLTAQLDELYYQDGSDSNIFGKIRLVDRVVEAIDVEQDILDKVYWTSSDGIVLTNGLTIQFGEYVTPKKYANNIYIVEGVGTGIKLVEFSKLSAAEPNINESLIPWDIVDFDQTNFDETYSGPTKPDYIVSNRASLDLNAWARQNRWYHISVLEATAKYNSSTLSLNQSARARRPIIEFLPNIQMFNSGSIGIRPVDQIDTIYDNAFNQIQHGKFLNFPDLTLEKGQRILFANDNDPLVRTQVYVVDYAIQDDAASASYYDGVGVGEIYNKPRYANFISNNSPYSEKEYDEFSPNLTLDYEYFWKVSGRDDLLGAKVIEGLEFGIGAPDATVTSVEFLGDKQYLIKFKASVPIISFLGLNVKIRLSGGSLDIEGKDTKFLTELSVGTKIYDSKNRYLGTVTSIHSDNLLFLDKITDNLLIGEKFSYKIPKVRLIPSTDLDDVAVKGTLVAALSGKNAGVSYWYNGTSWIEAQRKTNRNQAPLFDVFDENGHSLSSKDVYPSNDFLGTKIFSYKQGTGNTDSVLGFALYYTTSGYSSAEITFENNFDNDVFNFFIENKKYTRLISTGSLRKNIDANTWTNASIWDKVSEKTKQYQIISTSYTGKTNNFVIDIPPEKSPIFSNIKVYLNNVLLPESNFKIIQINALNAVEILNSLLSIGDKIDILIYSLETSQLGYYQIPINLEFNSENATVKDLNLGQIRNHFAIIKQGVNDKTNNSSNITNIKDLDISGSNGNILQHASPVIYSSLFLISKQANFINALNYARNEYTKFKNKFLETATSLMTVNSNQIEITVDDILNIINQNKNKSFSWYLSDMVPYGNHKTFSYKITNVTERKYMMKNQFDITQLQSRAVLVYFNGKQLTYGKDYLFDDLIPAIVLTDAVDLYENSLLEIKEYNTDGNYIPETPTKLGLYPKFVPEIFVDTTYQNPISVIQGHDGSITPCFGDFRDGLLLELETRIFNNIKRDNSNYFDINEFIPGQFRSVDYSLDEFNNVLASNFLKWVGDNRLDYLNNTYVVNGDLFSYNYKSSKNKLTNDNLLGWWRGIFKFAYDTDRPHTHPWEMLAFTQKPSWWETAYGPAPYTSNNQNLWFDLENGIIRDGDRKGVDSKYIRPGLSKIIPVDDQGQLLPPTSIIVSKFNSNKINESFSFGDCGPVETAWRKSSEYPFALQQAIALMKPAFYFGTLFDNNNYVKSKVSKDYLLKQNNQRVSPKNIVLNGEIKNGSLVRTSGYINYILDYLTSLGIDSVTTVRELLDNVSVQLSYKMAGFTDKNYLTVLAEQYSPTSTNESIIVPPENFDVFLNKSSPIEKVTYSAVIVEKTVGGFAVSGYSKINPYFIIIPSETSGESYTISAGTATATIYSNYRKEKILVPYGQEFVTKQQLVDFLVSYQRYLMSLGFIFDNFNDDLKDVQDWTLSAKEFLTWTLQSWTVGSILVLSPVASKLTLLTSNAVVENLNNEAGSVLDTNFSAIKTETLFTNRNQGVFTMESIVGDTFAFVNLNLIQFEHVLIFDNTTIFNDVIYRPELGNRQFRLKLIGSKTGGWAGEVSPPGFILNTGLPENWVSGKDYLKGDLIKFKNKYYVAIQNIAAEDNINISNWRQIEKSSIKTGLLPNFSQNASKFIDVYDLDSQNLDKQSRRLGSGLIGYKPRHYLSDLSIGLDSQAKFYQGYIKDKGTKRSIFSLLSASTNSKETEISLNEEWAIKVGEYGAQNINGTLDLVLDETKQKDNIIAIQIGKAAAIPGFISSPVYSDYVNETVDWAGFLTRTNETVYENDVAKAGYVNADDIDHTLFEFDNNSLDYSALQSIIVGNHIWVAKDQYYNWQVYRVDALDTNMVSIEYSLDMTATVTISQDVRFQTGDYIVIKQFDSVLDGLYLVINLISNNKFTISINQSQVTFLKANQNIINQSGVILLLSSVRYRNMSDIVVASQQLNWSSRTHLWVDSDETDKWAVYKKSSPWNFTNKINLEISDTSNNVGYGSAIAVSPNQRFLASGSPRKNNGSGIIHLVTYENQNQFVTILENSIDTIKSLGFSVDISDTVLVAGAPESNGGVGAVVVYTWNNNIKNHEISQIIQPPSEDSTSRFGHCVCLSKDNKTLYIGSPGNDAVYKYSLSNPVTFLQYIEFSPLKKSYKLKTRLKEFSQLVVDIDGDILFFGVDYSANVGTIALSDDIILKYKSKPLILGEAHTIRIRVIPHYQYVGIKLTGDKTNINFGHSIAKSDVGNILLVGAPADHFENESPTGSVYVFKNDEIFQKIQPNESNIGAEFGNSLACGSDGLTLYIGSPNYDITHAIGGAIFCYRLLNQTYELIQLIKSPVNESNQDFGYKIKISPNNNLLLISGLRGNVRLPETLDNDNTIFDGNNTKFCKKVIGSGAVYLYESMSTSKNSDKNVLIFTREFYGKNINSGDRFGIDTAVSDNYIYIGADLTSGSLGESGEVYRYNNASGIPTWSKIRQQDELVDITSINRVCLFDKQSNASLVQLDFIDPVKGKVLGIADQDLDYKTSIDPAIYNSGNQITDYGWGSSQIGKTWWDLSKIRYLDYEQSTLPYRLKTWGQVFPGSDIHVYEWIESSVKPSQYVSSGKEGIPLWDDDSHYCTMSFYNEQSKTSIVKYYYWARLINKIPENSNRQVSVLEMETIISNPRSQNIPYAAFLSKNSIALFNCQNYIRGNNTILRVYYDKVLNSNSVHREYALVKDGNNKTNVPDAIIEKMIDSLAGLNQKGQIVPDFRLSPESRLGIDDYLKQTMVLDRLEALRNIIGFINSMLSTDTVVLAIQNNPEFKNSRLNSFEDYPSHYDYKVNSRIELGYIATKPDIKVLITNDSDYGNIWTLNQFINGEYKIIQNQIFDTKRFWSMRPWYASGFNQNSFINHTVNQFNDISKISIQAGNIVKVLSPKGFELYYFDTTADCRLIGLENGAIEFSNDIWNSNSFGFDGEKSQQLGFDSNFSIEIRQILNALRYEILTGSLEGLFNQMLFVLINYILSEQKTIDWAFKTSFISVIHNIRTLKQSPNFIKDNQNYYIDYINEVKPYRTKIKDYILAYSNLDIGKIHPTDFDLPSEWDADLKTYRSPNGDYPLKDGELLLKTQYQDWRTNFSYGVESITIVNPGLGFSSAPSIKLISVDGFGSGATAVAAISKINGSIINVTVTNPGEGYIYPPTVLVNGDGVGAELAVVMSNNKVRSFKIGLKFDRTSYTTKVTEWMPFKSYKLGSLVSYQGQGYQASLDVPAFEFFRSSYFQLLSESEFKSANDRIAAIYKPSKYQPPKTINDDGSIDLSRLIPGIVRDDALDDGTLLGFGDDLSSPLGFFDNQIAYINSGGKFIDEAIAYAPEELSPGATYEHLSISIFTEWNMNLLLNYDADNLLSYNGGNIISDISGNQNNGSISIGYSPTTVPTLVDIKVIRFPADKNTKIDFEISKFMETDLNVITIEMWAVIDSFSGGMFFGWNTYDVWTSNGHLGFNTGNSDIYGISSNRVKELYLEKRWIHYTFIMNVGNYTSNKIYINGVEEELSQQQSTQNSGNANFNNGVGRIGGWKSNDGYQQVMDVGIFRVYGRDLTPKEIATLFNEKRFNFWVAKPKNSIDISQTWPDLYSSGALTEVLPNKPVVLAYRITKDHFGKTDYSSISRSKETVLVEDLKWDDKEIYVQDARVLSNPNPENKIPGTVFVGGEKINYYSIDLTNNKIGRLLRGVDRTSTPLIHNKSTIVYDAGPSMIIPTSKSVNSYTISFSKTFRTITTTFNVPNNLDQILGSLTLRIGINILELGKYYSVATKQVSVGDSGTVTYKALITFTKLARDSIVNNTEITISFEQEYIWINSADLIESNTMQARFLKKLPY